MWSLHVSFLKELKEEGIDKYTAFARQNEQSWKTVGSQAVSYLKKVQYVSFPPLLGDLKRQMPFASCLKEAKLFL